jgi:hypothetical protein
MTLSAGTRLGSYEIVAALGAGGMGEVYRAKDTKLDRFVALKVIGSHLAVDPASVARFEREAKAIAALSHPNILAIHDFGTWDGTLCSVTELLEGETLRAALGDGTPRALPPRKAIDYALQIARGLAAAHEKGIVHRDLKPENIFITTDGRVKILDFGLATVLGGPHDERSVLATLQVATTPGTLLGTVAYMSPEQARGQTVDHRSDLFSLGTILYEMVAGRKAFERQSAADTVSAILNEDPEPLPDAPGLGVAVLERVVRRCLEKKRAERFQSALDLAFALETTASRPAGSVWVAEGRPHATRAWLLAAGVVTAVAAALGVGIFVGRRSAPIEPPVFSALTYERGFVVGARFTPDGQVVYSAAWAGRPPALYSVRPAHPDPRPPIVTNASLLSVSDAGVMRVLLSPRLVNSGQLGGTLAEVPLGGGTPRELMTDVRDGDCVSDGTRCAIVRVQNGRHVLEFPVGTTFYETAGSVSDVRISPDEERVAFMDHPVAGDDRGTVAVIGPDRVKRTLTREWPTEKGLAWSADGTEVWFTASEWVNGSGTPLFGVTTQGRLRTIYRAPASLFLCDVTRAGHVLLATVNTRTDMIASLGRDTPERDVSWLDQSTPMDLSPDGKLMLFMTEGALGGPLYSSMWRRLDGSAPVRIGDGTPVALSPDQKWALTIVLSTPPKLLIVPLGAGQTKDVSVSGFQYSLIAEWLPDAQRFVFVGAKKGEKLRGYLQRIDDLSLRPITEEGAVLARHAVSPDGQRVVVGREGAWYLYPLDDPRPPTPLPGLGPDDQPMRWSADGRALFVFNPTEQSPNVYRYDLASGRKDLWKRIALSDSAGVTGFMVLQMSADGRVYTYGVERILSQLHFVTGLK